ncbi:NAD(P)H-binding protein [Rudaeicoccus suwonensis]|uniref:Putative NAD(P)-binding protein n=1 Tax=Rudaeicoccus suwonensis TaxID=657409 RepID=A0A561E477_9MICO|nr:NAD(P)H-binding protein [Rudaeicoccus suwonensis]TWE10412.1 putative NAD(P)-binding protein [Rudaeicoccus suwonensis]
MRLIARDPSRPPDSVRDNADAIAGSHADSTVLDTALVGADALFVLIPPNFRAPDATDHYLAFAQPIAAAVQKHGVDRVVAVSSLGRGYTGPSGLLGSAWRMDSVLESSGAAYRSLQPPFFMENLLHQTQSIRDHGILELPAEPGAPFATVATADIARVAAGLLADRSWTGDAGVLVRAPQDHTPAELAQIISDAVHGPVSYRQTSMADYRDQLASFGASQAMAQAMVEMAEAQADGVYPPADGTGGGTTFTEWVDAVLAPAITA